MKRLFKNLIFWAFKEEIENLAETQNKIIHAMTLLEIKTNLFKEIRNNLNQIQDFPHKTLH